MNQVNVSFRYGAPVTSSYPPLSPGAFTFDSEKLSLYLDTETERLQVKDPLKLSLTGGTLSGDLLVEGTEGTVVASISSTTGIVRGQYLEATGSLAMSETPGLYAVVDDTGRIRTRTRSEIQKDLGIVTPVYTVDGEMLSLGIENL